MQKIIGFLIGVIILTLAPMNLHTEATYYKDISEYHEQYAEIGYLYKKRVLTNQINYFRPNDAMTRQDFAVMIVRSFGYDEDDEEVSVINTQFKDVTKSNAASGYIQLAVNKGIIKGYDDGTFRPNAVLNRGHAATFLSRAYNFKAGSKTFKDVGKSHTAYSAIQQLVQAKVANGYGDGTFRPNNTLTRAHAAAFLARTMKYFSGEKFPLTEEDVLTRLKQKGYWPEGYAASVYGLEDGVFTVRVYKDLKGTTWDTTYDWYEVNRYVGTIEPTYRKKINYNLTLDQARRLLFNEGYIDKNTKILREEVGDNGYDFYVSVPLESSYFISVDKYTSEILIDV